MIVRLEMVNCGPYRGRHVLTFGAGAYAFVARYRDAPKKSNAVGKSFLMEIIFFALTGKFNKRRAFDVDGWITRGETEASVMITFEDGTYVKRSKRIGQSRQLRVAIFGRSEASQDEAQAKLFTYLKVDDRDLLNACYFEQREMARLVHMDPAARLQIVTGWLGLNVIQRAEERADEKIDEIGKQRASLESKLTMVPEQEEITAEERDSLIKRRDALKEKLDRYSEQERIATKAAKYITCVDQATEVLEQGKKLRKEVDDGESIVEEERVANEKLANARTALDNAKQLERDRSKVSLGLFDGKCPVAPIECPAKDKINKSRTLTSKAFEEAAEARKKASEHFERVTQETKSVFTRAHEWHGKKRELARLRELVKKNAPLVEEAKLWMKEHEEFLSKPAKLDSEHLSSLTEELNELQRRITRLEVEDEHREKTKKEREAIISSLGNVIESHTAYLKAKKIFRLARQRVATRALEFVEDDSNAAIEQAGVDLQVSARWERESKEPAKTCDECGMSFPTSKKVVTCVRCGASRGQHFIPRLDFLLSDSSGAYDDLAGIAWQASAGGWLLAHRQSPFATCMIDEPFAHADPVVREGLARYLLNLVRAGKAYRQMFVISHTSDTVDLIPNRITIYREPNGNRTIEQR